MDHPSGSGPSITQSFNTTTSMGRLTLNVLLSFAQFEREVIGERVRDKIAASKRKAFVFDPGDRHHREAFTVFIQESQRHNKTRPDLPTVPKTNGVEGQKANAIHEPCGRNLSP